MKRWALFLLAACLWAQQFKFDLRNLESKAANTVDVSLSGNMLQFAAKFMDAGDPEEANIKKLISGLEGIYVKSFKFKSDGGWNQTDLDAIRNQLRAPEWSRIVGVQSSENGENAEVHVRTENKKVTGVAILATDPRSFTVVNIVGPVDLDLLGDLGGHFGVPKVSAPPGGRKE